MPPIDAPLPLTPLVYHALDFAQCHHRLLDLPCTVVPRLLQALADDLPLAPAWSFREADQVDRYDIAGLFLYVRPDVVVLVAGHRVLCASLHLKRIYIRQFTHGTDLTLHSDDVILQAAL